jgi:hypothetical protein
MSDLLGVICQHCPPLEGQLQRWDEVPALSEDFRAADEAIRQRVIALVDELGRKQNR